MNNNPYGVNQLGASHVPYKQAKKMKELASEAPMSGAPVATSALDAPERARSHPQMPRRQATPAPAPVVHALMPQPTTQDLYAGIASMEGASDLVREIFSSPDRPGETAFMAQNAQLYAGGNLG